MYLILISFLPTQTPLTRKLAVAALHLQLLSSATSMTSSNSSSPPISRQPPLQVRVHALPASFRNAPIHSSAPNPSRNWSARNAVRAAVCAAHVHTNPCSPVMRSCRRLICRVRGPLAWRPFINRYWADGIAFRCAAVRVANATTAVVHGRSAICGYTVYGDRLHRMRSTHGDRTIH